MLQLARLLFVLLLVVGAILIGATTSQLPAQIASHFGADGTPNGWMSRDGYRLFMLAFAVVLPAVVVLGLTFRPGCSAKQLKIPNRDYWLEPVRRDATQRYIATLACWLGSLLVAFIAAIHLLLIEANATQPPHLPRQLFITLLVLFLVALATWIATMALHFRNKA
jgi:uncharacterized membrane protein